MPKVTFDPFDDVQEVAEGPLSDLPGNDNEAFEIDLSEAFNTIEPGEYPGFLSKLEQQVSKNNNKMWVFTLRLIAPINRSLTLYTTITKNSLWKLAECLEALGVSIEGVVKFTPNDVLGKAVIVEVEEDIYEGRVKPKIARLKKPDEATVLAVELDKSTK